MWVIKQYVTNNGGADPGKDIVHEFHMASLQHIDGYKLEAAELSHAFAKAYWDDLLKDVDNEIEKVKGELEEEYEDRCLREFEKLNREDDGRKLLFEQKIGQLEPKFWYGVVQSIVASLLVLLVVFFLFVATESYRIDAINTFRNFAEIVRTINSEHSTQTHPPAQE